jgi:hypothetical protein
VFSHGVGYGDGELDETTRCLSGTPVFHDMEKLGDMVRDFSVRLRRNRAEAREVVRPELEGELSQETVAFATDTCKVLKMRSVKLYTLEKNSLDYLVPVRVDGRQGGNAGFATTGLSQFDAGVDSLFDDLEAQLRGKPGVLGEYHH